jgi:hypothetical protein
MNLKRRLEAIERRLVCDPATLFFEDGTSAQLTGRGDYIFRVVRCCGSWRALSSDRSNSA